MTGWGAGVASERGIRVVHKRLRRRGGEAHALNEVERNYIVALASNSSPSVAYAVSGDLRVARHNIYSVPNMGRLSNTNGSSPPTLSIFLVAVRSGSPPAVSSIEWTVPAPVTRSTWSHPSVPWVCTGMFASVTATDC